MAWLIGLGLAPGVVAVLPAIFLTAGYVAVGGGGLWNDFAVYWLAGKLVAAGQTPYDVEALTRLGVQEGLVFEAGTGFSYPPPFAVAMVPLAALPYAVAAVAFTVVSLAAFGVAVAAWLGDSRLSAAGNQRRALVLALGAGVYPPVVGSALFGQANLLVAAALALGVRMVPRDERAEQLAGGAWIGLAGIVKIVPLALVLPLAIAWRQRPLTGVTVAASAAVVVALVAAPWVAEGLGTLVRLGEPDAFWTNQSINGYVSRLALGNDRVTAALPGLDPKIVGGLALTVLGVATIGVLMRARPTLATSSGVALAVGLTLAAAVAGAPKNSFWNHVPALVCAGLLLAPTAGATNRRERVLLAAWFGLALVGWYFDSLGPVPDLGPIGTVVSGAPVIGVLALWAAIASRLLRLVRCATT